MRGSDVGGGRLTVLRLACATVAAVTAALAAGGCTPTGMPDTLGMRTLDVSALSVAGAGPRTVAFESIDGPPEPVFRRLVARLTEEANARKVAVVSREQPSQYVIRGYIAAHVQDQKGHGQKTTLSWVWDVFTAADHQHAIRFTGEVPGAPSGRAWAAADDAVVARMAQDGMDDLATFLGGAAPASSVAQSTAGSEPLGFLPSTRP
jgi:hypothetical protein